MNVLEFIHDLKGVLVVVGLIVMCGIWIWSVIQFINP